MLWDILGRVGILLNSVRLRKSQREAFASCVIPLESEWNLHCPDGESTLSFLTHGIPHLLFLNHETAELRYRLHLSAPHRKLML